MTHKGKSVISQLLPRLGPRIKPLLFLYWRFARGMTLGVRCAVFNDKDEVFLVRHTYTPGWHFPGGGVEKGETAYAALEKELYEEGRISLTQPAELRGFLFNKKGGGRDHVAFYVARHWQQSEKPAPNYEIAETGFFPLHALPAEVTDSTRQRLEEIQQHKVSQSEW